MALRGMLPLTMARICGLLKSVSDDVWTIVKWSQQTT